MRVIVLLLSPLYQLFSSALPRKIVDTLGTIKVLLPSYPVNKCIIYWPMNHCRPSLLDNQQKRHPFCLYCNLVPWQSISMDVQICKQLHIHSLNLYLELIIPIDNFTIIWLWATKWRLFQERVLHCIYLPAFHNDILIRLWMYHGENFRNKNQSLK